MSAPAAAPQPLRVEQVLRLLPDVDALWPLRAFLMSTSRRSTASSPHLTVGKRVVRVSELPQLVPQALRRITDHLTQLYAAAIEALAAEERGDTAACVRAFVRAGDIEATAGRDSMSRRWYLHALAVAERAPDRSAEIDVLRRLGGLEASLGDLERAARLQQRSLTLAEAEGESARAALATLELSEVALKHRNTRGASAWLARGRVHAGVHGELRGRLALAHAALALATDSLSEAEQWITSAAQEFAAASPTARFVELLAAQGRLAARRGELAEALTYYREALVRSRESDRDPRIELGIRLEIGQLFLSADRLPDAEDEIRQAEELAIAHSVVRELARVYIMLGELRGRQRDESGFVFFEKAIELSRAADPVPRSEAEAYLEYARFRVRFGDHEESRSYLERAREILDIVRDPPLAAAVEAELAALDSP